MSTVSDSLLHAARTLAKTCDSLDFPAPVHTVYNTFNYALPGYTAYAQRYGNSRKRVLYLGMNPGPWGMAQTGVPFGEIGAVTGWLGLEAVIGKPPREHPKRPIEGYSCQRSEVSGRRLWALFGEVYGTAEAFFRESYILNYCPLAFMTESGANLTPDKLPAGARVPLEAACDAHLRQVINLLRPELAIGVGGWATKCLDRLEIPGLQTGTLLHPSPASPVANREWPQRPMQQLKELGIIV